MKKIFVEYPRFRPFIETIKTNPDPDDFLGAGSESEVWQLAIDEGDYVAKLPRKLSMRDKPRNIPKVVQNMVEIASRGLGFTGLEQVAAASLEDGVVIYERAQGVCVGGMTAASVNAVTDEQVSSLLQNVRCATRAGVMFDGWNTSGSNAFYDVNTGFTLIDYWSGVVDEQTNMRYVLRSFGAVGASLEARIQAERGEL